MYHRKPICDACKEQVHDNLVDIKNYLAIKNKELQDILDSLNDPCRKCPCVNPGPEPEPEPEPTADRLYGFAYSTIESDQSGTIPFQVASPRHEEVTLTNGGLQVSKAGVYQVSYTVSCKVLHGVTTPAQFKIVVNDSFIPQSSVIESFTTQHLSSTQLVSLLEGDVVRLVAEVSGGHKFSHPTLQLVMVGP